MVDGGACPNCAAGRPVASNRWVRIATAVAAAGTAMTLAACYGLPPPPTDSGVPQDSGARADTGVAVDSGVAADSGTAEDAAADASSGD